MKNKLLFLFTVNLFLWGTGLFFSPLEVYFGNLGEFTFAPTHVWWLLLLIVLAFTFISAFIIGIMPEKAILRLSAISVSVGLCFYFQSLFFNGQLQELTGETVDFSSKVVMANTILWIGFLVLFCASSELLLHYAGSNKLKELLMFISAGLTIIQLTGLLSTTAAVTEKEKNKDIYFSKAGEFELAEKNNVLYFILDTCDMQYVNEAMEEDPELFDEFTGFVCYPDATSMYSRTYPALPYLLTGEKCYFDIPYTEYIRSAYENSSFLSAVKSKQTDIRIYTSLGYVDTGAYQILDNIENYNSKEISVLSVSKLIKAMIRLGGYRVMPYLVKPFFSYAIDPVNRNVLANPPEDYYTLTNNDYEFYERLAQNRVTVNKEWTGTFRLYHLFGPHPGCYMNEYAQHDPNASQTAAFRGDIYILDEYIRQLKTLGIYDNTAIIVTADHGNQNENEDLVLHQPPCCIMLLKRAGSDTARPLQMSDAHVSHEDLFATVLREFGIEAGDEYSLPLYEHENDYDRVRTYYYTAQRSWGEGEVVLKEYWIFGDARNFSNWSLTGNEWDIRYSQNAISKNK